ncbi:MAG: DUF5662 family protein [Clostridia bacterium]|jgi:hypothetical protein|nr:DUF5662 family protein [Clostridia bacterium]MDY5231078.1 DUF5662 family protein [Eubacteriales bacterium]
MKTNRKTDSNTENTKKSDGKITLKKIIGHFKTITRHRHTVIAHSRLAGILFQGLRHDLSKYSPTEFIPGARFYCGDRSPNEEERALYGYSAAWLHHKGRNRHHFEYWSDYNVKTKEFGPVPMPPKYIAEMFCDRVAASKIYQGKKYTDKHPLEYFMRSKGRRPIDPNTSDMIEGLLRTLAEDGEDAAFAAVRKMLKESKSAR